MIHRAHEYQFDSDLGSEKDLRIDNMIVMAGDYLAFWAALIVSHIVLASTEPGSWTSNWNALWAWDDLPRLYIYFSLTAVALIWFWAQLNHYSFSKPLWSEVHELWHTIGALAVIDLAVNALLHVEISHAWWLATWISLVITLPIFRYSSKRLLLRLGYWRKPTYIIGTGPNAEAAFRAVTSDATIGCSFMKSEQNSAVFMQHALNPSAELSEHTIHTLRGARVILALEHDDEQQIDPWMRQLLRHGIRDISVIPPLRGIPLYGANPVHFFCHDILMLRIRNNVDRKLSRAFKRMFDLSAAVAMCVVLCPLLIYLYWRVRREGGNPIFGHERIGESGKRFICYKFRTMVPDAAERLTQLLATSSAAREEWDRELKLKDDPRITKIGHLLRETSLDELPQLWNVIRGDMSLVGPRPITASELERYGEDVSYYLLTKPGLTGLWQISGRNDIDYATRVYLDVWYLKNWSIWYDLAILLKTVGVVVNRHGAY